jgi:hypothetical protein
VVEEIIGRLPELTGAQLGRLEDELRRERQLRASSAGGGEGAPQIHEGTAPPVTKVLEYHPHEDGYLQLELRRYVRRDGSTRERGPYWYFQFHEGGKRRKLYLGKTSDPEGTLAAKRAKLSGEWYGPLAQHVRTRSVSSRRLGSRKEDGRDTSAKSSLTEAYRNRAGTSRM